MRYSIVNHNTAKIAGPQLRAKLNKRALKDQWNVHQSAVIYRMLSSWTRLKKGPHC